VSNPNTFSIILACNAGSTNTKLAVFDAKTLERRGYAVTHDAEETAEWINSIGKYGIAAIGHRVVHGGLEFTHPTLLNDHVQEKLKAFAPMAPLHQPAALRLIEETRALYPNIPQIACFDTAFHHTAPEIERRLPLPAWYHRHGIQRYGFHGLSYQYIASTLPEFAGKKAKSRVIVVHLGGGASACAMKEGKSVASTMGFSTLDGLMMGTRCGALDPGVILYLLKELEMRLEEVDRLLYLESGLLGVSGISGDIRQLLSSDKPEAREALELFCRLAAKQIAGLLPSIGGLDVLVFTGGIGENATAVRERIVDLLRWIGDFPVYVIPTDEEKVIADACHFALA
jgi:acetate kinase